LVAVFGGAFLLIYLIFESVGIGEYVWPILIPVFGWTFGIMAFVFIIIGVVCKAGGGMPSDQKMVRRTYTQPTYPTYDSPATGSVYVVPVYCPNCMNKLELDKVEWVGSNDLTCPSCFSVVQAGVRENI
jgi:hypothetical protein